MLQYGSTYCHKCTNYHSDSLTVILSGQAIIPIHWQLFQVDKSSFQFAANHFPASPILTEQNENVAQQMHRGLL